MCASSAGAHPMTRLTARPYNGYIGSLTVIGRRDGSPMCLRSASRRPATSVRRCSRIRRSVLIGATVACGAFVTTGCGSGSAGPGVAQISASESGSAASTPAAKSSASSLALAECMRSHGVPDFPDPGPLRIDVRTHPDLDPSSPAFVAAQKACLSLAPGGARGDTVSPQQQAAALAYSACMRSHGFPKFPDPVFSDGGEHVAINGLDTDSALFQNADKFCQTSTGLGGHPSGGTGP